MDHSGWAVVRATLALALAGPGCALVGYNFDDYGPASTGGAGGVSAQASSSSASTGLGGAASTGSSSSSGMTGGEDCVNSVDDDNDGALDCADPECAAYACVELAPAGWSGPLAFHIGAGAPPGCGTPWVAADSFHGGVLSAPGSQCQCSCSSPQGSCVENVTFYSDDSCMLADGILSYPAGACGAPLNTTHTSTLIGVPQPSGISCSASLTAMLPPPVWELTAVVCSGAALGGGCAAGSACAPAPPPQFPVRLCIDQAGDVICPAGAFTDRFVIYKNVDDTRSCTACSCGPASGVQCQGNVSFYYDTTCTTAVNGGGPGCYGGAPWKSVKSTFVPSGGACPPSGGTLMGGVVPASPFTVCCAPAPP